MKLGRKISGGKYKKSKKKKKYELGKHKRVVGLRDTKQKKLRVRGGNIKVVLLSSNEINVIDPKTIYYLRSKIPFSNYLKNKFPSIYESIKKIFYFFVDKIKYKND